MPGSARDSLVRALVAAVGLRRVEWQHTCSNLGIEVTGGFKQYSGPSIGMAHKDFTRKRFELRR